MKTTNNSKRLVLNNGLLFSGKFWKSLTRYKSRDNRLKRCFNKSISLIGRKDLESKYGLGPGETLGV